MDFRIWIFIFIAIGLAHSAPNGTESSIAATTRRSTPVSGRPGSPTTTMSEEDRCGNLFKFDRKVGGDEPPEKDDWPWMAAMLYSDNNQQFCGGALISDRHVLTAANCIRDLDSPSEMTIRLGEYDFQTSSLSEKDFKVKTMKMHEQYSRSTQANDIALLTLANPVVFSKSIKHICLPDKNMDVEEKNAYVIGFGRLCSGCQLSTKLLEVYLPIWNQSECVKAQARFKLTMLPTQLCAGLPKGGKDSCQGDSGGPLMIKVASGDKETWMLVGIVSYGIGCGQPNTPGIYTRVSSYLDWIKSNARG